ncbi:MAG: hypothetical protein ACKKL4_02705 [Patescibacteria group bacterium]
MSFLGNLFGSPRGDDSNSQAHDAKEAQAMDQEIDGAEDMGQLGGDVLNEIDATILPTEENVSPTLDQVGDVAQAAEDMAEEGIELIDKEAGQAQMQVEEGAMDAPQNLDDSAQETGSSLGHNDRL